MLRKLIKYDFKSTGRLLWIIYIAVIAAAVVLGISIGRMYPRMQMNASVPDAGVFPRAVFVIYILLLLTMAIITMITIIRRFYQNLLGSKGYLMHTLPVPTWMLVASKLIVAIIWEMIAVAVAVLSAVLMLLSTGYLPEIRKFVNSDFSFFEIWPDFSGTHETIALLVLLASAVAVILQFYLSMAIGNLSNSHKGILSVGAFILIMIITTIIDTSVLVFGFYGVPALITQLIYCAVFFYLTQWILKKKLNLA